MRKLKEMARLRYEAGRTLDEVAAAAGVARSTVQTALERMAKVGLSWPWPAQNGKMGSENNGTTLSKEVRPNRG